ncbi:MAG: hypothetical protein DMD36_08500 [Gemmatimonadetes bacterium]|nr:MAG: hypothetical protein DMD36_08500 [Gemmatimonadota bacterium]
MTHEACSLCRKEESQVGRLARVEAALICDGCIAGPLSARVDALSPGVDGHRVSESK